LLGIFSSHRLKHNDAGLSSLVTTPIKNLFQHPVREFNFSCLEPIFIVEQKAEYTYADAKAMRGMRHHRAR
jgi:hypothetical protein